MVMRNRQKKLAEQCVIIGKKMPQTLKECSKMRSDHVADIFELDTLEATASPVGMFRVNVLLLLLYDWCFSRYILFDNKYLRT